MRKTLLSISKRLNAFAATLLLLAIQAYAPFSFMVPVAAAAPECVVDTAGANDEPGQKDLNKLCIDYAGLPTSVVTTWNWDETGTNGANTMDACSLFDTDGDGNINYAVCVTTQNDPATLQTVTTYSCGDDKIDRCTSPATPISNGTTSCSVTQVTNDPFPNGASKPKDTQGSCTVQLSTIGGASAKLIDVCSYPSSQPNSDPSDCVIIRDSAGKVELIKDLIPGTDTGKFNLSINGPEANDTTTVNNVGDGGTTGEVVVKAGSVVVSETAGTSTALSNYSTTIVCRDLNGTGSIVGQSTPTGADSRQLTFTLADQADVVCTITNTRSNGSITLIKNVINDNGGTAGANDFGLSIGGTSVTSGQARSLAPGSYAINEAGLAGYQFVSITGTGCPTTLGGNVVLASNQNITCTITNDDIGSTMRVIKNVVNDNGGNKVASDFTLSVNNVARTQNQYFNVNAGSYTVTETGPAGYTMTGIVCVNDANQQTVSHPVSVGLNQAFTCTVTNNDNAPGLTVVKNVINNDGGTATADDFVLRVNSNALLTPVMSNGDLTATYTVANVQANTPYTVSEDSFTGYAGSSVSCVDNTTQQTVSHPVTLNPGQSVTCTITNNDVAPKITVVKYVTNDNGGTLGVSDFPLYVGNVQVTSGVQNSFGAGLYVVSETNQPGYTAGSWGGDCAVNGSITLQVGGVYTCSITNNDQPAHIKVTKNVINDNGGNAVAGDFTLKVNATTVVSGVDNTFNGNVSYTISETNNPAGYTQTALVCNDVTGQYPVPVANPFTSQLGHYYECVITNDDVAPSLTVVKKVVNDNGGTATVSAFDLEINDNDLSFGSGVVAGSQTTYTATPTVSANTNYTLSEIDAAGYAEGTWSCTDGTVGSGLTATVNLDEGEQFTCTVTNNDIAPTLEVTKRVLNDNGGDMMSYEFNLYVNGDLITYGKGGGDVEDNSSTGIYPGATAGVSYTVTEDAETGYTKVSTVCTDADTQAVVPHPVTLAPGQNVNCVVTNNDVAPKLTLVKYVTNNNGGSAEADDWTLTADPTTGSTISGDGGVNDATARANTPYSLSETGPSGYSVGIDWDCTGGGSFDANTNVVTLEVGDDVTCTITNDDQPGTIKLIKRVVNDNGGDATQNEWTLHANGPTIISGADSTSDENTGYSASADAGVYTLSETNGPSGYDLASLECGTNLAYLTTANNNQVTVSNGVTTYCVFTNDDIAPKLTLIKNVVNDNGGTKEAKDWTLSANPIVGTQLSGNGKDGVVDEEAVANKTYHLSEVGPEGYDVSVDWTCDGGAFDAQENTIKLGEGDDVTCQITNNDKPAKVTIIKHTNSSSEESFDFTSDWGNFSLSDGWKFEENNVNVGSYDVLEKGKTGWKLGTISCEGIDYEDWTEIQEGNNDRGVRLNIGLGDDVTCTFNNNELGRVTGHKFEDYNGNGYWDDNENEVTLSGWTIQLWSSCDNEPEFSYLTLNILNDIAVDTCEEHLIATDVTDENGAYDFSNLDFGNYKVCEVMQSGWSQTYPVWDDGCHEFKISRSGQVVANKDFGNLELGSVSGYKFNDQNGNAVHDSNEEKLSGWTITLTKHCSEEPVLSLNSDNVTACEEETWTTVTDQNGNYSFGDLELGEYTICEVQKDGWTRTYPNSSDCHEFTIDCSGVMVTAHFGNKAKQPGRVLGELVNTGTPMVRNLIIGAIIVVTTIGVAVMSKRRSHT